MQRWLYKILMFVAVATILGHSSLPHLHHAQIATITHHAHHVEEQGSESDHHDHDQNTEDHHNIFSFAQLDENFVPVKFQDISIELPVVYLLTPVITYHYNLFGEKSKPHFGFYKEYPPPGKYLSKLTARGPPSLSNTA